MSKDKKKSGLGKFVLGAAVGAAVGVLLAPKKGSETRKELNMEDVKFAIEMKVTEIKNELEDLDKEKVLKIAKKQASNLKDKADELVNYAIEKGTPVLEKAADAIREKTIVVTKDILNKLEKEEKQD